jgi:transcriptional regulator with XRE-family HTH domain
MTEITVLQALRESLADLVLGAMHKQNCTAQYLSDVCGVPVKQIRRAALGESNLSLERVAALLNACGVTAPVRRGR